VAQTENFHGGFHSVAYGHHLYLVCAFVTSQFDIMFIFLNQHFGEVCWHNRQILSHAHTPYFTCHCTEY